MLSIFEAIFLGLLQGITEFFPISSSGHLVLFEFYFGYHPSELLAFNVAVHLATLFAVVCYFYTDLKSLAQGLLQKSDSSMKLLLALVVATIPVVIAGVFAGDVFESIVQPNQVAIFMLLTAVLFIGAEYLAPKKLIRLNSQRAGYALVVGLFQVLAMLPGVSRSGSTLAASMLVGETRSNSARFSFLIAIPAILGAVVYTLAFKAEAFGNINSLPLLAGFIAAFVSGFFSIKFLMHLYQKHSLKPFAIYLVILGALLLYQDPTLLCDCAGP